MYRKLFLLLNFGMAASFGWAYWLSHNAEWKKYQGEYYRKSAEAAEKAAAAAKDPVQAKAFADDAMSWRRRPLEIKQIIAKDLGRVDRCISCHVGMDEYTNPTLKNDFTEHPYKAHPAAESLGKKHQFQKFGCTVCHQGQGLATEAEDSHGFVHNWEKPLLKGALIQGSCVKCHEDYRTLKGAELAAQGRGLMEKHGCFGCHSIKGFGGTVSENLEAVADKPFERISLYHFPLMRKKGKMIPRHDWNVQEWIRGHLVNDPMVIVPNDPHAHHNAEPIAPSGMPNFTKEISEDQAESIVAYLMAMTPENIPSRYYVFAPPPPEPKFASSLERGKFVFQKYGCQGCHGLEGKEGRRNFNAMGPGQSDHENDMDKGREPTLVDVVGTYTRDELRHKIESGVSQASISKFNPKGPTPPLFMPAWKDRIKGAEMEDLLTWLLSIGKKSDDAF